MDEIAKRVKVEVISAETAEEVAALKERARSLSRCVILISKMWAHGLDFRFAIQPGCFIYGGAELPSNYEFQQMAGRAQRSNQRSVTTLFMQKNNGAELTLSAKLMKEDTNPFKDGVRIFKDYLNETKNRITSDSNTPTDTDGYETATIADEVDWVVDMAKHKANMLALSQQQNV